MKDFLSRASHRLLGAVRWLALAVFGQLSWQPPVWLHALGNKISAHRRGVALGSLVAALAVGGGGYAYHWWKHRPRPRYVHASVDTIAVTALRDDALRPDDLVLRFDDSAAPLELIRQMHAPALGHDSPAATDPVIAPALVRLEPAWPGRWRWETDCRLVFTPGQDWPAEQTFHVVLDHAALAPHVLLRDYRVEFCTPAFGSEIRDAKFYQNPKDPTIKQVTATFCFTHAVDLAELDRRVSVQMLGHSPVFQPQDAAHPFTLTPGRHRREFFLRTAPLTLPGEADTMKLLLAAGLPTTQGGARLADTSFVRVGVADLYSYFHVEDARTKIIRNKNGEPEQFLFVETRGSTRTEDLAKALAIYHLPKVNPHRHDPADADDAKADHDDQDNTDDQADDADGDNTPPVDRDGRFHDDYGHRNEDVQIAEDASVIDHADDYDEWTPNEVDADALAAAQPLAATVVPSAEEWSTVHTFRIRLDAPGWLCVKIRKGVKALGGYELRDDYLATTPVPIPDKEINIQGDGGILALSGERKLSVQSRGVPAIRYEIARVPAAQINHLASQTRGDFENPEFRSDAFDEENIARITAETQPISVRNPVESNYSTFDFSSHLTPGGGLGREGLFFLTASAWDPDTKKYLRNLTAKRFVLVTDLGLLVKRNADGSRDIFAQSLGTGNPLGGVTVAILARNGAVLVEAPTDAEGRVSLPSLGRNTKDSREPVAITARLGDDVSFLPYEREGRNLDFSRFPIEGLASRTGRELDAFVFTERGVYRPGDEIHVGTMVKQRDWNGQLAGLPVETEVIDARDHAVQVKKLALPASGFCEWSYQTAYESPTGGYTLNVYLLREGKRSTLLGSETVQVKEFLPDRIKLEASLSKQAHGWVTPEQIRGAVVLKNLYGTPASDRLIKAHARLNPRAFSFKEFADYTFYDRLRDARQNWEGETLDLGEKHTADDGTASFNLNLERFADVTYRVHFLAEGFEAEGGRSVQDDAGVLVSPLPFVVGTKAEGDLNYIKTGGAGRTVEFIGVDRDLKRVPLDGLNLRVIEQVFVSVLTKRENGNYEYESIQRDKPVGEPQAVNIGADGWKYPLPCNTPGNFRLELRDAAGLAISKVEFSVVGQGEVTRSLEKNAELAIKLDKTQYRAGDQIEIAVTAPYAGSGLITVERERVYTHKWFKATATSSVQTITLPPDFDGTGYVNVSFLRALDSKEIFMSPLSYAVAPFTANMECRRLNVELHAAEKSKPGEPLAIRYRTDHPAKIAVFAVDQGILQVTRYPLPDPLAFQFRKVALSVRTSQMADLLLPEFSLLRAAQSAGGDGDPGALNPFRRVTEKPVVFWSGIIDADQTERTVTYPVPDYFSGTLTLMAVAVSPDAVGSVKASTLIHSPFTLTPGVPTLAAPGDEFTVGVTVANSLAGSGPDAQITLQAEPSEGLTVVRGPSAPLHVAEGHETSTTFVIRALDHLGSAQLGFRASAGGEESRVHATLSIRPVMPFRTVVRGGSFRGETQDAPVTRSMYPDFRRLEASISALPLGLAHGLERYLKEYPHGCSEQITSGAFARLALAGEADFGLTRAEAATQLEHTLNIERRRQNDQGGFGYWSAGKTDDIDFISVYVTHFLSEARAAGFAVPDDLFQPALRQLKKTASAHPSNLRDARVQAYAIYVLTREGITTTNDLLALRDFLDNSSYTRWQRDLTAVYMAGSWALLKKQDEAERLIGEYHLGLHDRGDFWDFHQALAADAQYLTILARHFPDRLKKITADQFQSVVAPIGRGDFNTLSAAYAVVALKAYSDAASHDALHLSIGALLPPPKGEQALSLEGSAILRRGPFPPTATQLRFHAPGASRNGIGIFYQTVEAGFDHAPPAKAVSDGMEIYRELTDGTGKPVTQIKLGESITVRVKVRSLRDEPITNTAILDLLPGGFEVAENSLQPGTGTVPGMDYVEVREDRAIFYGTLTKAVREIVYKIQPTCRGAFTVPPIYAESMYDHTLQALGLGGKITVTEGK